jgi:hypothetical protein
MIQMPIPRYIIERASEYATQVKEYKYRNRSDAAKYADTDHTHSRFYTGYIGELMFRELLEQMGKCYVHTIKTYGQYQKPEFTLFSTIDDDELCGIKSIDKPLEILVDIKTTTLDFMHITNAKPEDKCNYVYCKLPQPDIIIIMGLIKHATAKAKFETGIKTMGPNNELRIPAYQFETREYVPIITFLETIV